MSAYFDAIDEQIDRLLHATGLPWELENTGGGHDALIAYLNDDQTSFVMLTCDASVVRVGRDRFACLGLYSDYECGGDPQSMAYLNDESFPPLTLDQLVDFVAETLRGWGVI
jgi:hypothetical protein